MLKVSVMENLIVEKSDISQAFTVWVAEYLNGFPLTEEEYDQAMFVAERLEFEGRVNHSEWLEMVWRANAALVRCT